MRCSWKDVTFSGKHLVAEALDSVLALPEPPFEVSGDHTFVIWL